MASKIHPLAQAGHLVRLLLASEVLPAAFVMAVSLETPKVAGALEALTEEVMGEVTGEALEEVTGKLKE